MEQKKDEQSILELKAQVYDLMGVVEQNKIEADNLLLPYQQRIDEAMKQIGELNKQIQEQQNKE